MIYLIFFLLSAHIIFVLLMLVGFQKALSVNSPTDAEVKSIAVSVIIPFRNEAENLPALIRGLKEQRHKNFEVILIDDDSIDNGFDVCTALIASDRRFKLLKTACNGKKHALTEAIRVAKGEIITTTDADCLHGENWLVTMSEDFHNPDVKLVFGFVKLTYRDLVFERLQALEFSGVVATGVAAYGLGSPVYCNGANLAFRREIFWEVNGYEDNLSIPSGDDEFLLKKIASRYRNSVRFQKEAGSFVETKGAGTVNAFVHQRMRWAAKWRHTQGYVSKIMAVFILFVQCAVLLSAVELFSLNPPSVIKYLLGGKIMIEFVFLFTVSQYQKQKFKIADFVFLQLVYPFYIIYVGVVCNFMRYEWKGRSAGL